MTKGYIHGRKIASAVNSRTKFSKSAIFSDLSSGTPSAPVLNKSQEPRRVLLKPKEVPIPAMSTVLPGRIVDTAIPLTELAHTLFAFTDGSCLDNRDVHQSAKPAGWGVVLTTLTNEAIAQIHRDGPLHIPLTALEALLTPERCTEPTLLFGPVLLSSPSPSLALQLQLPRGVSLQSFAAQFGLEAEVGSNNTGELWAIGEALLFAQQRASLRRLVVLYDSEYAACS
eukprot:gene38445-46725_t